MSLDLILGLAEKGVRILPIVKGNKVPAIDKWRERATTDEGMIRAWEQEFPGCNWAAATGESSGIFVVDIDAKNGGLEAWNQLIASKQLPHSPEVLTGTNGKHIYFQYPKNAILGNSVGRVARGVDIRGNGGLVVIPPSIHPNGRPYTWTNGHEPSNFKPAKAPGWLVKLAAETKADEDEFVPIGEKMEMGTRNNHIFHQSLVLAKTGALKEVVIASMKIWCSQTGELDITDEEIIATVDSAFQRYSREKDARKVLTDIELSDVGNATRFKHSFADMIMYAVGRGWHIWNQRRWEYDDENLGMKELAIKAMTALKDEVVVQLQGETNKGKAASLFKIYQWAINSHNVARITSMVEVLKSFPEHVVESDDLDGPQTNFHLNFMNGTLDMKTGVLQQHDKKHMITKMIKYNYNPDAQAPAWENTLRLAFDGNEEMISFFQRAIGYSLTGDTSEQCFFICWGESGNNGKSTMLEAIQTIIGRDYAAMSDARVVSSKDKDNHVLASLAQLPGVRLVSINEMSEFSILDEELVKQLTGGDTLQAKKLFQSPFTFKPVMKIWVRANNKPTVRGTGDAFWRRVKLIPFNKPIPVELRRPRYEIDAMLMAEAEGILAWALRGFKDWYENGGLRDPQIVKTASAEYRNDSDIITQFAIECIEEDPNATVARQVLYSTFAEWSKQQGIRYTMSADKFSRRIAQKFDQHTRVQENRVYVWQGMKLTETAAMHYSLNM